MSYIKFEELKSRTLSEQVDYLEGKIQSVRDRKEVNTTRIKQLEENNENLNAQIEILLEMKWNCKAEERVNDVMDKAAEIVGGELSENEVEMLNGNNPANKMNITMEQNYDYHIARLCVVNSSYHLSRFCFFKTEFERLFLTPLELTSND